MLGQTTVPQPERDPLQRKVVRKNLSEAIVVERTTYKGRDVVQMGVWCVDAHGRPQVATGKCVCARPGTMWAAAKAMLELVPPEATEDA